MNKRKQYKRYISISQARYINQVGFLIGVPSNRLREISTKIVYDTFSIPKHNGGVRTIENPYPDLKNIQRALNKYLQCMYYQICPDASYGFVMNVKRQSSRTIVSNATQHIGANYMMNIDLKHFFHTVSQAKVDDILMSDLFALDQEAINILSEIICYKGRLPMGAPTSPVMSNLACINLDHRLMRWCQGLGITYTRYADDMTFSSKDRPMTTWEYDAIARIIRSEDYTINLDKVKVSDMGQPKMVTGIYVNEYDLSLSETFFDDTLDEIAKLKTNLEISQRYRSGESDAMKKHKQMIRGYINYAYQVYGYSHEDVMLIEEDYQKAINTVPWDEPVSWRSFPYHIIDFDFSHF